MFAYLCGISNLEESGTSVQDCGIDVSRAIGEGKLIAQYLLEVLPWSQFVEVAACCSVAEGWCDGRLVGSLTRSWGIRTCAFP
jgi:hypothetical protein